MINVADRQLQPDQTLGGSPYISFFLSRSTVCRPSARRVSTHGESSSEGFKYLVFCKSSGSPTDGLCNTVRRTRVLISFSRSKLGAPCLPLTAGPNMRSRGSSSLRPRSDVRLLTQHRHQTQLACILSIPKGLYNPSRPR